MFLAIGIVVPVVVVVIFLVAVLVIVQNGCSSFLVQNMNRLEQFIECVRIFKKNLIVGGLLLCTVAAG